MKNLTKTRRVLKEQLKFILISYFLILLLLTSNISHLHAQTADQAATKETKALFNNLKKLAKSKLIFGHQNTVISGKGWKNDGISNWKSDVDRSVGDFPGVYGFDFIDGMQIRRVQVEKIYRDGGIITFSWHAPNPITNRYSTDKTGKPFSKIMPGQSLHDKYKGWLDTIANFFNSLEVEGKKVPIIFRPFHEMTNGHFWWSDNYITPELYKKVYRWTIDYLRNTKGVHNLLYVYNPTRPVQLGGLYDGFYPGNDYVDMVSFDIYWGGNFGDMVQENAREIVNFAERNNKIPSITEAGIGGGIDNNTPKDWFTKTILNPLLQDPVAKRVSYFLTWRNTTDGNKQWVPLEDERLHDDFRKFYDNPFTLFHKDLPNMYDQDDDGETETDKPPFNKIIALQKSGGDQKWITAWKYNTNDLSARADQILEWEKFLVEWHPSYGVALKALSTGKYIQVNDKNIITPIRAKGEEKGKWEHFIWKYKGTNQVALKSAHHERWLQAKWPTNNAVIYATGIYDKEWETFNYKIVGSFKKKPEDKLTDEGTSLSIYPNPAKQNQPVQIQFNVRDAGLIKISILDLNGKLILEQKLNNLSHGSYKIDLNEITSFGLTTGIYILKLQNSKNTTQQKFTIL